MPLPGSAFGYRLPAIDSATLADVLAVHEGAFILLQFRSLRFAITPSSSRPRVAATIS